GVLSGTLERCCWSACPFCVSEYFGTLSLSSTHEFSYLPGEGRCSFAGGVLPAAFLRPVIRRSILLCGCYNHRRSAHFRNLAYIYITIVDVGSHRPLRSEV